MTNFQRVLKKYQAERLGTAEKLQNGYMNVFDYQTKTTALYDEEGILKHGFNVLFLESTWKGVKS